MCGGDAAVNLLETLTGKSISYKLTGSASGSSTVTIDGTSTTVAANATIYGTCDAFALAGTKAGNMLAEVRVVGNASLPFRATTTHNTSSTYCNEVLTKAVWAAERGYAFDGASMFSCCTALEEVNIQGGAPTSLSWAFYGCKSLVKPILNWDTSAVTNMRYLFEGCTSLADITPLAQWDTSKVTNMYCLFEICTSLADVSGLASWDTSKVTNMGCLFYNCTSLADVSALAQWDTSKVTDMSCLFESCTSLADVSGLASWDTSAVTDMGCLFEGCTSLADITPLANWHPESVEDLDSMLQETAIEECTALADWDVSKVTNMDWMFCDCTSLTTLAFNDWDFGGCIEDYSLDSMFGGCTALTTVTGSCKNISVDLSLSDSPLTRESALVFINGLKDGVSATLTLSEETKALLTDDDIAIATGKGWTIA